jgi:hypothetical protein
MLVINLLDAIDIQATLAHIGFQYQVGWAQTIQLVNQEIGDARFDRIWAIADVIRFVDKAWLAFAISIIKDSIMRSSQWAGILAKLISWIVEQWAWAATDKAINQKGVWGLALTSLRVDTKGSSLWVIRSQGTLASQSSIHILEQIVELWALANRGIGGISDGGSNALWLFLKLAKVVMVTKEVIRNMVILKEDNVFHLNHGCRSI